MNTEQVHTLGMSTKAHNAAQSVQKGNCHESTRQEGMQVPRLDKMGGLQNCAKMNYAVRMICCSDPEQWAAGQQQL